MTILPIVLAQTGAVTEVTDAVDRLSGLGFMGLVILLTLIGSLIVWNVYADKKRYDKANEREHERWDKQMENWKSVYDDQRGAFDDLKDEIKSNTAANDRVSDSFVRYAEHQVASSQETAKRNREVLITFSEVRGSLAELAKTINLQANNIGRLSDDTRRQVEIIARQTDQNTGTLDLVKAFANELSRHEKAAIARSEQIHSDFQQMHRDRQDHLDEMKQTISGINAKLDALLESQRKLTEAVTILIRNGAIKANAPAADAEDKAA